MLNEEDERARELTAYRKTLNDPQKNDENGCEQANRRMCGEYPHEHRGHCHGKNGQKHSSLPAHEISDAPKEETAQGPNEKASRKSAERGDERYGWV